MLFDASLTAWATFALAFLALATAIFAGLAWWVQKMEIDTLRSQLDSQQKLNEAQMPVLKGQLDELGASRLQREEEARARRESYVSRVFTWHEIDPSPAARNLLREQGKELPPLISRIHFKNTTEVPVYYIIFIWHINGSYKKGDSADGPLIPGGEISSDWRIPDGIDLESITTSVFIMDAKQQRWRVTPDGKYTLYDEGMLPGIIWATVPKLK